MKALGLCLVIQGRTCVPLNIAPACDYVAFQKEQPA
jgi:hypothetical protein